jgi:hypothetical protein
VAARAWHLVRAIAGCRFAVLALFLVLALTLFPSPGSTVPEARWCLICGQRGAADALLNVILFLPLGMALARCGIARRGAFLTAVVLSASIELVQVTIPGRDASLGDLFFNGLGALAGAWVFTRAAIWMMPAARRAWRYSLLAVGCALVVFALTGHLLESSPPQSQYYGFWTPDLGHLEPYRGRVLMAELGGYEIGHGRIRESARVRRLLLDRAPLEVMAIAGPPTSRLGGLLAVYDDAQREVLLVGPDRSDLVFRYHARATSLRLDQPDIRLAGGLRTIEVGDTLEVRVLSVPAGYCLVLDRQPERCSSFGIGDGWTLLFYIRGVASWLKITLGILWVALMVLPTGYWAREPGQLAVCVALVVVGLLLAPSVVALVPAGLGDWLGVLAGLSIGVTVRRLVEARLADGPAP